MAVDYIIGLLSRVGAVVVALIITAFSIATVKIIDNNEALVFVRDHNVFGLSEELEDLHNLIILTQTACYYAFVLCGITVLVGAFSIILLLVNKQPIGKLFIIGVVEMVLVCLGMFCFLSLGIACTVYANSWGGPPDACERANESTGKDFCDSVPLTATNALQGGFSFVVLGLLGAVIVVTIFSLRSRPVTTTTTTTTTTHVVTNNNNTQTTAIVPGPYIDHAPGTLDGVNTTCTDQEKS